jgi:peptide chain release factor subunit 1
MPEATPELKKYEFRRKIEELRQKHGRGTELISVYIPHDKQMPDVTSQLRDERGQASNIKGKSTRLNVQSALDSILSRLKNVKKAPEGGVVIFCGAVDIGGDKTSMEIHIVEPIEPVVSYKYHCDSEFFLEPLEDMLTEKRTYGLLVLDRREATVGLLKGKRTEYMRRMTSTVPGKQRKGGQSSARFQRLREVAIEDFFNRIGKHASDIFLPVPNLVGVLIGGPSPTKEEFIKGEYLHYEIQKKILGAFDVSYTDESGLSELVDKAQDALQGIDLMREKKVMDRFMRELVSGRNLATYGEQSIRENLKMGSVETLIVSEELRLLRAKVKCGKCGYEGYETIKGNTANCKKCSAPLEVTEAQDVVLELTELASRTGAGVELISMDFEEGAQLKNAFGGIAAILRYNTNT